MTVAFTTNFGVGDNITGGISNATAEITAVTNSTTFASDMFRMTSKTVRLLQVMVRERWQYRIHYGAIASSGAFYSAGDAVVSSNVTNVYPSSTPTYGTDQRKIRVRHSNHCMHDSKQRSN